MKVEHYDGVPVQVPRQGTDSYAPPAQQVIAKVVASLQKKAGPRAVIHSVRIIRVMHEDDLAKVKVFYDASVSRLAHDTPLDAVLAREERGG